MQISNLRKGLRFTMGKGENWRVVHPDMGAKQLTLNHGIHAPGREFTQHVHDESEDCFVILEGGVSVRQGDVYTPIYAGDAAFIPVGEVHGTVNTSGKTARLMSFQSPPDMALYRGERDKEAGERPTPESGHRSAVQIITMAQGGPIFGKPGDWRSVVAPEKGAEHLAVDYIQLGPGEGFEHEPEQTEVIYVLTTGQAEVNVAGDVSALKADDIILLSPGDTFSLSQTGEGAATLVRVQAQG